MLLNTFVGGPFVFRRIQICHCIELQIQIYNNFWLYEIKNIAQFMLHFCWVYSWKSKCCVPISIAIPLPLSLSFYLNWCKSNELFSQNGNGNEKWMLVCWILLCNFLYQCVRSWHECTLPNMMSQPHTHKTHAQIRTQTLKLCTRNTICAIIIVNVFIISFFFFFLFILFSFLLGSFIPFMKVLLPYDNPLSSPTQNGKSSKLAFKPKIERTNAQRNITERKSHIL